MIVQFNAIIKSINVTNNNILIEFECCDEGFICNKTKSLAVEYNTGKIIDYNYSCSFSANTAMLTFLTSYPKQTFIIVFDDSKIVNNVCPIDSVELIYD